MVSLSEPPQWDDGIRTNAISVLTNLVYFQFVVRQKSMAEASASTRYYHSFSRVKKKHRNKKYTDKCYSRLITWNIDSDSATQRLNL